MKSIILSAVFVLVSGFAASASADAYPYHYKIINPTTGQLTVIFPRPASTGSAAGWNYVPLCPSVSEADFHSTANQTIKVILDDSGDPCAELINVVTAI